MGSRVTDTVATRKIATPTRVLTNKLATIHEPSRRHAKKSPIQFFALACTPLHESPGKEPKTPRALHEDKQLRLWTLYSIMPYEGFVGSLRTTICKPNKACKFLGLGMPYAINICKNFCGSVRPLGFSLSGFLLGAEYPSPKKVALFNYGRILYAPKG